MPGREGLRGSSEPRDASTAPSRAPPPPPPPADDGRRARGLRAGSARARAGGQAARLPAPPDAVPLQGRPLWARARCRTARCPFIAAHGYSSIRPMCIRPFVPGAPLGPRPLEDREVPVLCSVCARVFRAPAPPPARARQPGGSPPALPLFGCCPPLGPPGLCALAPQQQQRLRGARGGPRRAARRASTRCSARGRGGGGGGGARPAIRRNFLRKFLRPS